MDKSEVLREQVKLLGHSVTPKEIRSNSKKSGSNKISYFFNVKLEVSKDSLAIIRDL